MELTNKIIDVNDGLFAKDLNKIEGLRELEENILGDCLPEIDKIYWLIEYIKRFGTLPFAGVARAAFIAVQMLKSFVTEKIISSSEYETFLNPKHCIKGVKRRFTKSSLWGHVAVRILKFIWAPKARNL